MSGEKAGTAFSPVLHIGALFVLAVFLGGGGVAYGLRNLVIQLAALLILAAHPGALAQFWRSAPRFLIALVIASIVLPLVQIVPLPASIWQALPGREPIVESFELAGLGSNRWFPLSVDPARSLVAFCGTLAPAVIIIVASTLGQADKVRLGKIALAACFAAFALGVLQLSSGNTIGLLFPERTQADVLYATFANRNSTALFFVMALSVLAVLPRPTVQMAQLVLAAAGVLMAIAVVLTQSRSGIALLVVPAGLLALRLLFAVLGEKSGESRRPGLMVGLAIAGAVLVTGALGASYITGGRAAESAERFAAGGLDDRAGMWDDSLYSAGQYWPAGSGMGTFDEVFQLHESLEYVSPRRAGRAHSDWLEIAIEGGVLSLLIALGWLAWSLYAVLPRGSREAIWLRLGAGGALGCVVLQSLVDYPLRNQSLLCLAAICVALLAQPRSMRT